LAHDDRPFGANQFTDLTTPGSTPTPILWGSSRTWENPRRFHLPIGITATASYCSVKIPSITRTCMRFRASRPPCDGGKGSATTPIYFTVRKVIVTAFTVPIGRPYPRACGSLRGSGYARAQASILQHRRPRGGLPIRPRPIQPQCQRRLLVEFAPKTSRKCQPCLPCAIIDRPLLP